MQKTTILGTEKTKSRLLSVDFFLVKQSSISVANNNI